MSLLHLQDNKTFHNNSTIWLEKHSIHKFKCYRPRIYYGRKYEKFAEKNFFTVVFILPSITYTWRIVWCPVDLSSETIYGGSSEKLISKHEGGRSNLRPPRKWSVLKRAERVDQFMTRN